MSSHAALPYAGSNASLFPPHPNSPPTHADNMGMGSLGAGRAAPITPMLGAGRQALAAHDAGNSSVKESVLDAIRKTSAGMGDTGTTVDAVFQFMMQAGTRASKDEVNRCINSMTEEGSIYSTVDEHHFLCID